MGPPENLVRKMITMLNIPTSIPRDITLICAILALFDNVVDACDTDEKQLRAQNNILFGFLISLMAQSQYDAQNSQ